jgi:hypothetical protein
VLVRVSPLYDSGTSNKTTLLELSFAERGWSILVHTRTFPFLSRVLHHGIVRLTTGSSFVPKIMLTHGEIQSVQWPQMDGQAALCRYSKRGLGSTLLVFVFVRHRPGITRDPATLPISVILDQYKKDWGSSPRAGHPLQIRVLINFHNASYCTRLHAYNHITTDYERPPAAFCCDLMTRFITFAS